MERDSGGWEHDGGRVSVLKMTWGEQAVAYPTIHCELIDRNKEIEDRYRVSLC